MDNGTIVRGNEVKKICDKCHIERKKFTPYYLI